MESFIDQLPKAELHHAELTVTSYTWTSAGMPAAGVTEALDIGARKARAEHGVRIGYIFDIAGELGGEAATATLDHALSCPPEALTGFGLAGIEQARPAHRDVFRDVFAAAIAAGLHSVPHAGEMSGPETIWEALTGLYQQLTTTAFDADPVSGPRTCSVTGSNALPWP